MGRRKRLLREQERRGLRSDCLVAREQSRPASRNEQRVDESLIKGLESTDRHIQVEEAPFTGVAGEGNSRLEG